MLGSPDLQIGTPEGVQQGSSTPDLQLVAEVVSSINSVGQQEWDACAIGGGEVNPFLLWTFLHCLEESGSAVRCLAPPSVCMHVGPPIRDLELGSACPPQNICTESDLGSAHAMFQVKSEGWLPQHILIRSAATQELLACMPLYMKVSFCTHHVALTIFDTLIRDSISGLGNGQC